MRSVYLWLAAAGAIMFFTAYYAMYGMAVIVDRLHFLH